MKRTTALMATLMLTAMAMPPVFAEDAHHPDQKAGAAAPSADQAIQKMQAMQENMMTGKGMMGGGMMDCPMMKGGMMGGGMGMTGPGMSGSDDMMVRRMEMMEKRMDMMQMMMQKNMGMPQAAPASPAK